MISDRGYIYCRAHGALAKSGGAKARKLRPWEVKLVEAGKQVPSYRPGPKPVESGLEIPRTPEQIAADLYPGYNPGGGIREACAAGARAAQAEPAPKPEIQTTAHVMAAIESLTREPIQVVITSGVKGVSVSVKKGVHPSMHVAFSPEQARELAAQLIARAVYIEQYQAESGTA